MLVVTVEFAKVEVVYQVSPEVCGLEAFPSNWLLKSIASSFLVASRRDPHGPLLWQSLNLDATRPGRPETSAVCGVDGRLCHAVVCRLVAKDHMAAVGSCKFRVTLWIEGSKFLKYFEILRTSMLSAHVRGAELLV